MAELGDTNDDTTDIDFDLACPTCNTELSGDPLFERQRLCPVCRRHFWIAARERIALLVDEGSFLESTPDLLALDSTLGTHELPVADRLSGARELPGIAEAVVTGTASVEERPVAIVALDLAYLGGNIGIVAGEKVSLAMELAATRRLPLVLICSGGAASGPEGVLALAQIGKLTAGASRLHRLAVPFISLLTHPSTGAALIGLGLQADVVYAEPRASLGSGSSREPDHPTSTAEQWHADGQIDGLLDREVHRQHIALTLDLLLRRGVAQPPARSDVPVPPSRPAEEAALARDPGRPSANEYLERLAPNPVWLHGDRAGHDDSAVQIGLARFDQASCGFVLAGRRGEHGEPAALGAASYRKASRLVRLAGQFELPIVVIADAIPAQPVAGVHGEIEAAIAAYVARITSVPTPVVCVLTGEVAGMTGFAFAIGDRVIMQRHSLLTASGIVEAATARECERLGVVDAVAGEPEPASHADPDAAAEALRPLLAQSLAETLSAGTRRLLDERLRRLRSLGLSTDASREAARLEVAQLQELQRRLRASLDEMRHRFDQRQAAVPSRITLPALGDLPQLALPAVRRQRAALSGLAGRVAATGRSIAGREPDISSRTTDETSDDEQR
jgi:acetyl-CoA carboxylase carboxyl transferase subunit beta